MVAEKLDWQAIAAKVSAPPRKVVVAMLPHEDGEILVAGHSISTWDEQAEANAFAEFSMPKVKAFFEEPKYRAMEGIQRQHVMGRLIAELREEFRGVYHRAIHHKRSALRITRDDLGVVVASDGYPEVGAVVACHPEDGSWLDAFGEKLRVFGAFLPEMGWTPQYCDWWESLPVQIENDMLRAYGNKIVIQLDGKKEKVGELYIPETAQWWNADCTVLSVGKLQEDVSPGERWSVDMSLVTNAGLEFVLGDQFTNQFVVPPEALNFRYAA